MERLLLCSVVCLVLSLTIPAPLVQGANPCDKDIARFCSNISPGKGRIAKCLKENESQLSPGCRMQHLEEVAEALRQTSEVCSDDSVRFCGSFLQKQDEGLLKCLKINAPALSPDCRAKLFKALELLHY